MQLPNIQIGDGLLGDALLASVEVVQALNQHWWCTVECRQSSDEPVPVERFLGQTVEVRTFDEDGVAHVHFTGFILKVELLTEVWGSYGARLLAASSSYKLDLAARKQYYAEHTLAAVAAKACGYAELAAQVQAPAQKPLNYVQYGETDFAFLHRIVDDYGCWMRPGASGLEIFNAFQSGSTVGWRGEDGTDGLIGFKVRSRLSPASYSGSHYDHHAMASETYESVAKPAEFYPSVASTVGAVQSASASALPSGFEPQRARAMTLGEYRQQLGAEAERSMGASVTGTGESRSQLLKAGDTVEIEGTLEPGGVYGLTRVEHRWRPEGYSNTFECTPWKQYRNPQPPAQRDWQGVVAARVVEHNDPKKMGRLRVQFFWQGDGATHWARMVSPHAGPDRGFMWMPEVGDEVAVAFEDGDPERPILLGSLWNGVQQAPREEFFGSDIPANDIKRIVTKSGNRLQMVDTPGRETVVATPNHTSMAMTEKSDATGRELVALHSDGDIVLSAPAGRVHFQSKYFSREVGEEAAAALIPAAAASNAATGLSTPAPPATAIAAKQDCAYLKNDSLRVIPGSKQFDPNRKPYQLGPSSNLSYAFPGHPAVPATLQTATIGGHPVKIIRSVADPTDKATSLPTNDELAHSLGAVPQTQLNMIQRVVVSPDRNPDDAVYGQNYGMAGFRSEATSGVDGNVHFYPVSKGSPMALDETLVHETGHTFSKRTFGANASTWKEWPAAMTADDRAPSQYGAKVEMKILLNRWLCIRPAREHHAKMLQRFSIHTGTPF